MLDPLPRLIRHPGCGTAHFQLIPENPGRWIHQSDSPVPISSFRTVWTVPRSPPLNRDGVVVLSNAFTRSGVVDIGLHLLNPKVPLANPEPPKQHTEIPIDPKLLDNYTGRYQLTPNLIFEITHDGDRLYAQGFAQGNGQSMVLPKFELFAEGEKNFFAKVADNQIAFETDPDGRATSLIMHRAGREMPAASRLS